MERQQTLFKGRDKRDKNWFWLNNEYLNGYAKHFGPVGTAIYLSLCRHVDENSQQCFPAQKSIAEELGISRDTVSKYLKIFEQCCLIEITKERDQNQKWANNIYTLLDKKYWKKPEPCGTVRHGEPCGNDTKSHAELSDTNKTQNTNKTQSATLCVAEGELSLNAKPESPQTTPPPPPFDSRKYLKEVAKKDKQVHVRLIASYALEKGLEFPSVKAVSGFIARNARIAKELVEYSEKDFFGAIDDIKADKYLSTLNWGLETILKKLAK